MKTIYTCLICLLTVVTGYAQGTALAGFRLTEVNNTVEINFAALSESNMATHYIERSTNGSAFLTVGTIAAQNSATPFKYQFIDAVPVLGRNYYRLKSVNKIGGAVFSGIANINMGVEKTDIVVLPNPVRNGVINLQLNNIEKGKYAINLFTSIGQRVFSLSFDHPGGSSTEILNLPANVGKGAHFIQVTNGLTRMNKQLFLQ